MKLPSITSVSALTLATAILSIAGCASPGIVPPNTASAISKGVRNLMNHGAGDVQTLYVSGGTSAGVVEIFTVPTYRNVGTITEGVKNPGALWVDNAGNLYVVNSSNVTEYARGTSSPMCSYTVAHGFPRYVTTDAKGHVYITASVYSYSSANSYIYGFNQCGSLIKHYAWPHQSQFIERVGGIAADAHGNVFVRFACGLEEFKSDRFVPTNLHFQRCDLPYGLILDQHHNLIATGDSSVYVVPPPYRSVRVFARRLNFPQGLSLNRAESRLFVVDVTKATVNVYEYPSGKQLNEFGSSKGISAATGVAVSPDAVF